MEARQRDLRLGEEIRRLRLLSGTTLRGLATRLGVSAAHLSDIEHDRRRPSERLLRKIAHELRAVGASFETLHELITGIDPEIRDWVASTPGVRRLLLKVRESGEPPQKILRVLEKTLGRDRPPGKPARDLAKNSPSSSRKSVKQRKSVKP